MRILFSLVFFCGLFCSTTLAQRAEENGLQRGMDAFDAGQWQDALRLFDLWIQEHTGDSKAYLLRGQTQEQLGDELKANADYSIAVNLNPEFAEAYFARGRSRYLLEQYENATEDFLRYLELPKGETSQIIFRKSPGDSGFSQIHTDQAENPAQAYYHLGLCAAALEEFEGAVIYFEMALEANPRDASVYVEKGRALGRMGENDLAIQAYEEALTLDPSNSAANLGLNQVLNGGSEALLEDLNETVSENFANSQTFKQRGFYRMSHDDPEGALEDFDAALALDDGDPESYFYRGRTYASMDRLDKAEADFSKAISIDPQNTDYYLSRGQSRYRGSKLKAALADFTLIVSLDPESATGYFHKGITFHRLGDLGQACSNLAQAKTLGMIQAEEVMEKICK